MCETYGKNAEKMERQLWEQLSIIQKIANLKYIWDEAQFHILYENLRICSENLNCYVKKFGIDKHSSVISDMYDNANSKAKCYDYDNLESKRIRDIITLFTMTYDSPCYCDVYHTSEFGDANKNTDNCYAKRRILEAENELIYIQKTYPKTRFFTQISKNIVMVQVWVEKMGVKNP